jgi:hypothetical protein
MSVYDTAELSTYPKIEDGHLVSDREASPLMQEVPSNPETNNKETEMFNCGFTNEEIRSA